MLLKPPGVYKKCIYVWPSHTEKKVNLMGFVQINHFILQKNFYLLCSMYWHNMQYAQTTLKMIE